LRSRLLSVFKRPARSLLARLGYELHPAQTVGSLVPGIKHVAVKPRSTYAPWLTDTGFQQVFEKIVHHTAVDIYRCYELWRLAGQSWKVPGDILEVGVWKGGTGCLIASALQGQGDSRTVWLCDTFKGVVKAGDKDTQYKGGEFADTSTALVEQLIEDMGLKNIRLLEGIFPDETGPQVQDRRFSLCHIDVDVYQSAKDVFDFVWPRMSVGGVVVFDDYGFLGTEGIIQFVNEQTPGRDRVMVHNLNGHAIAIKNK
jgi:O-methyltransferase